MNPEEMWARWNASPLAFESNPDSYSAMAALAHDAIEALDAAQTHTRELDDALQAACAERDALIHDNAELVKAANHEATELAAAQARIDALIEALTGDER